MKTLFLVCVFHFVSFAYSQTIVAGKFSSRLNWDNRFWDAQEIELDSNYHFSFKVKSSCTGSETPKFGRWFQKGDTLILNEIDLLGKTECNCNYLKGKEKKQTITINKNYNTNRYFAEAVQSEKDSNKLIFMHSDSLGVLNLEKIDFTKIEALKIISIHFNRCYIKKTTLLKGNLQLHPTFVSVKKFLITNENELVDVSEKGYFKIYRRIQSE